MTATPPRGPHWKHVTRTSWQLGEYTVRAQSVSGPGNGFRMHFVCSRGAQVLGSKFYLRDAQKIAEAIIDQGTAA